MGTTHKIDDLEEEPKIEQLRESLQTYEEDVKNVFSETVTVVESRIVDARENVQSTLVDFNLDTFGPHGAGCKCPLSPAKANTSYVMSNSKPHGEGCMCDVVPTSITYTNTERIPETSAKANILLQLKNSIDMLSSRMSTFETTLTSKIDRLETNYCDLNGKINNMGKY